MTIDAYTKVVLTIIAGCLLWLCVHGFSPAVSAQAGVQRVVVADWEKPVGAILVDQKGMPLFGAQGFRVNLGGQPMAVTVGNPSIPVTVTHPVEVSIMKTAPTPFPAP
jgi:hypothetical protein